MNEEETDNALANRKYSVTVQWLWAKLKEINQRKAFYLRDLLTLVAFLRVLQFIWQFTASGI